MSSTNTAVPTSMPADSSSCTHAKRVLRAFSEGHRLSIGVPTPAHLEVIHESPDELSPPAHRSLRAVGRRQLRARHSRAFACADGVILLFMVAAAFVIIRVGHALSNIADFMVGSGVAIACLSVALLVARLVGIYTGRGNLFWRRTKRAPTPLSPRR